MNKKHLLPLALAFALSTATAQNADFQWTASDMGPWDNAANWTPNGVPGAEHLVSITSTQPLFTAGDREVKSLSLSAAAGLIQVIGSGESLLHVSDTLSVRRAGQVSVIRGHVSFQAGTLGLKAGAIEVAGGRLILGQAHQQTSRALTRLEVQGPLMLLDGAGVEIFTDGATASMGGIQFKEGGGTLLLNNGNGASRSVRAGYLAGDGVVAGAGHDRQRSVTTLRLEGDSGRHLFNGRLRDGENGQGNDNRLSLVKAGAFTQILSGENDFSGDTTIEGGELVINGDHSRALGQLTVTAVGILAGNGRIGGPVQIEGTLRATDQGMDFNNDLTLAANSQLAITLGDASKNDKAYLRGSSDGTLAISGTLFVRTNDFPLSAGDRIQVFSGWGTVNGGFTRILAEPLPSGLSWDVSQLHTDGLLIIR